MPILRAGGVNQLISHFNFFLFPTASQPSIIQTGLLQAEVKTSATNMESNFTKKFLQNSFLDVAKLTKFSKYCYSRGMYMKCAKCIRKYRLSTKQQLIDHFTVILAFE